MLVVATSYPASEEDPSGHFVRAEVRKLERAGHAVTVVAPEPGGAFGWPGAASRIRENPARAVEAAAWIVRARRDAARADADKIVAHWAVPCAFPIARGGAPHGVEVVSHGGDVRMLARMPSVVRSLVVRRIAQRASVWRFVSTSLFEELATTLGERDRAIVSAIARVEAPPIELPDVATAAEALRGRPFCVAVGRLVPDKHFDRALDFAAARNLPIVVVGDGPERARLEAHARRACVDARFVGLVPRLDALAWIAAADLLVHASVAEGLSTVVREAEALGTRVERIF
jgi:glycosyltransferase involved in cell wall biosynthesis